MSYTCIEFLGMTKQHFSRRHVSVYSVGPWDQITQKSTFKRKQFHLSNLVIFPKHAYAGSHVCAIFYKPFTGQPWKVGNDYVYPKISYNFLSKAIAVSRRIDLRTNGLDIS